MKARIFWSMIDGTYLLPNVGQQYPSHDLNEVLVEFLIVVIPYAASKLRRGFISRRMVQNSRGCLYIMSSIPIYNLERESDMTKGTYRYSPERLDVPALL